MGHGIDAPKPSCSARDCGVTKCWPPSLTSRLPCSPCGLSRRPSFGERDRQPSPRDKLFASAYLTPSVKRHKNDAADADAISDTAQRLTTPFVAVQSEAGARSNLPSLRLSGGAAHSIDQFDPRPSGRVLPDHTERPFQGDRPIAEIEDPASEVPLALV